MEGEGVFIDIDGFTIGAFDKHEYILFALLVSMKGKKFVGNKESVVFKLT